MRVRYWRYFKAYAGGNMTDQGTHLMDVKMVTPFYYRGKRWCWLSNTGHWPDIGGAVPGGFSASATSVEQEGLRRYLESTPALAEAARQRLERQAAFVAQMLEGRRRLEAIYAGAAPDAQKRQLKQAELARLGVELQELVRQFRT